LFVSLRLFGSLVAMEESGCIYAVIVTLRQTLTEHRYMTCVLCIVCRYIVLRDGSALAHTTSIVEAYGLVAEKKATT